MSYFKKPPADDSFDHGSYDSDQRRERLPEGQTLAKKFPHLEYASIPKFNAVQANNWHVCCHGELEEGQPEAIMLPLNHLMVHYERQYKADFHCITGWSLFDCEWTGAWGRDVVQLVKPKETVTSVLVKATDQFSTCMWIEDFMAGMLAWGYRGKSLSAAHGFPLRFIAPPHLYQYKSCKWVIGLEFLTEHKLGFWEIRAYSDSALVADNDRYTNPLAAQGKSYGQVRREALEQQPPGPPRER